MSNVLALLEKIGGDGYLRYQSNTTLSALLDDANISGELKDAILYGDPEQIERLLGATRNVCCVLGAEEERDDGCATAAARLS
jgi:hypothetical protein